MSGGMATIAGGVLAAYIGYLGGSDVEQQLFFARHLLTASIISAPAAIVASKIIFPEREKFNEDMSISQNKVGGSVLEAISNGTSDGLKLAVNVGAMLLVFIAMVAMANYILSAGGEWMGLGNYARKISNGQYSEFSMEFVFGYAFAPLSWMMGIPTQDILLTGQLLGQKTVLNEFFAYYQMGEIMRNPLFTFSSEKSIIMTTYALCGFANFASIGIQIGGIGSLAPERKSDIAALGFKALIAGTLACFYTATVVGLLY
jgi:CNT family concentrative nucleoside transporter